MATPLSQFLSFLLPTRNPPPKPPQLPVFSSPPPSSSSSSVSLSIGRNPQRQEVLKSDYNNPGGCSEELTAVMCPSLAHANTLYFRSAYNVQVVVEEGEAEERLLNRFRREVMRAGVIQECKRRRYFENKQDEKKRRTRDAAKRNSRKRRFSARAGGPSQQFRQEPTTPVAAKDDDLDADNWEMPDEGGIPN